MEKTLFTKEPKLGKWAVLRVRMLLKISVKEWKGLEKKGYRIDSVPMKKLKTMTLLATKTWELKDGFLVLEATV